MVLSSAAQSDAVGAGLVVVGSFVLGVVVTTLALAVAAAAGWAAVGSNGRSVRVLTVVAATASGAVGALFLFGAADRLPTILVG